MDATRASAIYWQNSGAAVAVLSLIINSLTGLFAPVQDSLLLFPAANDSTGPENGK